MTNVVENYLQNVLEGLNRLPESDRNEILKEIRNHIYEAINRREPEQTILARLGSPLKLAQSYVNAYKLNYGNFSIKYFLSMMSFYFSAGMTGIFVVPTLFLISIFFPIIAAVVLVYSVIGLFFDIPGVISLGFVTFTGFPQLIASIIVSPILFIIGVQCWRSLKKYLLYISNRYQSIRLNK